MASPLLKLLQRREDAVDQRFGVAFLQIQRPRAQGREQGKGDVGRAGAVRRSGRRVQLPVVRREEVILRRAVNGKVVPALLCVFQQQRAVVRRQRAAESALPVEQICRSRTDDPQDAYGHGGDGGGDQHQRQTERGRRQHPAKSAGQSLLLPARLRGCLPLEKLFVRDRHAPKRAHDPAGTDPRLPRQQPELHGSLHERAGRAGNDRAVVFRAQLLLRAEHGVAEREQQSARQTQQRRAGRQPQPRPAQPEPEKDRKEGRRRDERAPQAVKQPPAVHRTKALAAPEQPRQVLPVAAHPSLHARVVARGRRGEAVCQLHVPEIAAAKICALQRVVGQHAVFRQRPVAAGQKRVDVENALSGEAAAVVAVHIQLTAMRPVGICAALTGEQACKVRPHRAFKLDGHARVQQSVALCDRAAPVVDHGGGQRMEHRADQLHRRPGAEKGVAVERDEIPCCAQPRALSAQEL